MTLLCEIISPTGFSLRLPYYEVEEKCKHIVKAYTNDSKVSSLERQKRVVEFYEYQIAYQTFSPYFDFVFKYLGFTLKNPFFIPDSRLFAHEENGITHYYALYQKDNQALSTYNRSMLQEPLFIAAEEKTIVHAVVKEDGSNLTESFIDEQGKMIYLDTPKNSHNFWANTFLHYKLIKSKEVCQKYQQLIEKTSDFIYFNQGDFIMEIYPWMRFCMIWDKNTIENLIIYDSRTITSEQQKLLIELKRKKLLSPAYILDRNGKEPQK